MGASLGRQGSVRQRFGLAQAGQQGLSFDTRQGARIGWGVLGRAQQQGRQAAYVLALQVTARQDNVLSRLEF
jgi:hypothetical protein